MSLSAITRRINLKYIMKKLLIFTIFAMFICLGAAQANAASPLVYTYKSSLEDISCVGGICVAVGNNTILRSVNKGVTWKVVLSKKIATINEGSTLSDIDCAENLCIAVGSGATMVRSIDSGKTWKVIDNVLVGMNSDFYPSHLFSVDCIDKKICYAIGTNYYSGGDAAQADQAFGTVLLKTIDGGLNWDIIKRQSKVTPMGLLPTANPIIMANQYSIDQDFPLYTMRKIACKSEMECFGIGLSRSVLHTTDGWQTATMQQFAIDEPVQVLTNGPNDFSSVGYVVNGNIVAAPEPVARYDFASISFTGDGGVIIENLENGNHNIFKSVDDGATWQSINIPFASSLHQGSGQIVCYKSNCALFVTRLTTRKVEIFTSSNNGNTWKKGTGYNRMTSIFGTSCADAKNCFAVGDTIPKGVILKAR